MPLDHADIEKTASVIIYLLRRIFYVVPITLAVSLVCFMLVHIAPGDPINAILPPDAPQELVIQVKHEYGL
ncbi:MAG: peptide/nickel transport system permease protein, partial [Caballeronia sp.]|nr:peptide/nickel transport system permease protein [Caballeronia sp.]